MQVLITCDDDSARKKNNKKKTKPKKPTHTQFLNTMLNFSGFANYQRPLFTNPSSLLCSTPVTKDAQFIVR